MKQEVPNNILSKCTSMSSLGVEIYGSFSTDRVSQETLTMLCQHHGMFQLDCVKSIRGVLIIVTYY